ncbi:hypothetical protein JCM17478_32040 [Thermopirellula anaerolimosa]
MEDFDRVKTGDITLVSASEVLEKEPLNNLRDFGSSSISVVFSDSQGGQAGFIRSIGSLCRPVYRFVTA